MRNVGSRFALLISLPISIGILHCSRSESAQARLESLHSELLKSEAKYVEKAEKTPISDRLKSRIATGKTVFYFSKASLDSERKYYEKIEVSFRQEHGNQGRAGDLHIVEYMKGIPDGFREQQKQVGTRISEIRQEMDHPGLGTDNLRSSLDGLDRADKEQLITLYSILMEYLKEGESITSKYLQKHN